MRNFLGYRHGYLDFESRQWQPQGWLGVAKLFELRRHTKYKTKIEILPRANLVLHGYPDMIAETSFRVHGSVIAVKAGIYKAFVNMTGQCR
jgi:hypothetical protein